MVPWLMMRSEVPVADMARQFGISEADLIADIEMAAMCGMPPYSPWELTEMWIEDGIIHTGPNKHLERRLALSKQEAFGLALLARAATELPNFKSNAALKSALAKIEGLNHTDEDLVDVDVDQLPHLDDLTEAALSGERLVITHWKPESNTETVRRVTVRSIFTDRGKWYVTADDEKSGEVRHFRVDRIRRIERTGEFVTPQIGARDVPVWFAEAGTGNADSNTTVVIELAPEARWVAETYPCREVEELEGGRLRITIVATSEHWLGRLLLRTGGSANLLSPAHLVDLGRRTAASVLALYRSR